MKKIIITGVILIAVLSLFLIVRSILPVFQKKDAEIKLPPKEESEEISVNATPRDKLQGGGYQSVWLIVRDPGKVFLYTNLDDKKASKDLATQNSCIHLISGGFYDVSGKHIGLLVSEGETLSRSQENSLFNAYFSISGTGTATITDSPVVSSRLSLQTGPFLIKKGAKVSLSLERDENARRLALGLTNDKKIIFFAVYDKDSTFYGPKLAELPDIIENINKEKKLSLTEVINLDGGTHSAFISDLATLSEASPIGSYFCIKP
jgi:exopolysaccharide biosynthesis protein